jgi:hypothetical protein
MTTGNLPLTDDVMIGLKLLKVTLPAAQASVLVAAVTILLVLCSRGVDLAKFFMLAST